ncbi:monovalent cation/H+ antiporter subunit D family protein [Thiomicrospira microaerophila]|uniref:complex I subunit 5 family protein n=1 Tax=Thiomicrospira microaerophila TaxID=406020 RepID=UPI002010301F|nr:proton-conducting transporter membrane subunit [Thiomicrospira microaerophila]UQB42742.1 monovalent cation/H+ antiporter subunit D family protein [Thiomicrospira microaerophila]
MIDNSLWPLMILASSLIPALLIFFIAEDNKFLRSAVNIGGALIKLMLVVLLVLGIYSGEVYQISWQLMPGLAFSLRIDGLAVMFLLLSAFLWLLTTIYAIGYLENSPNRARFFGFFTLCVSATAGVAMAGNLFTFVIFYELLTLATWPLVVHRGTEKAIAAGRVYLRYTLIGGGALLLGTVLLHAFAGSPDFMPGGYLADLSLPSWVLWSVFILLIAGLGVKAALVPFHSWLPQAMVAPAPVSALLHAVAVVKAGAFGIVRVMFEVYGIEYADAQGMAYVLLILAALTIVYGSVRALYQTDIKKRLAFSTVSQVSYVALGIALAGPMGAIGGLLHIAHQGLMKITLFMTAGNYAETLGIHKIDELNGVGRRMPWNSFAFTLAALGMIGLPPMVGFLSKWYLGIGAWEVGAYWVMAVLFLSSLLNAGYFLPLIYRAWFLPTPTHWPNERRLSRHCETHWMLLLPPLVTALTVVVLGLVAGFALTTLGWVQWLVEQEFVG